MSPDDNIMMPEALRDACQLVDALVSDNAAEWDLRAKIPIRILRDFGTHGLLCPQAPKSAGGRGLSSLLTGEFTAYLGSRCSSLRSVMTSHGMAAWTIQKFASHQQRDFYLAELTSGKLAAVGFSEPEAGSDLSAMTTSISRDGRMAVVNGHKVWVTAADYADLVVIYGRLDNGAAAVLVPTSTPGVHLERIADPLGCRAAGHAHVYLDNVRLPIDNILGCTAYSLPLMISASLTYGRISVAWGCVGILRACLGEAASHARARRQFGKPIGQHQLIKRHLAELYVLEQSATRLCERASQSWDSATPDMAITAVLAKHFSACNAVQGAAMAVQVLASAGVKNGDLVARAYRDSKLMEIIEGTNEVCQLILADHVMSARLWD
jgi:methoxymalonate biosynthesis protein